MNHKETIATYEHVRKAIWDYRHLYVACGIDSGSTFPPEFEAHVEVNGMMCHVHPTASKPHHLYRAFVKCHCERVLPWAKMGQHRKVCKVEG